LPVITLNAEEQGLILPSGNQVIHSYCYTKPPGMALNASAPPVPLNSSNASVQPSELTRKRLQSITGTIDDDATESEQDVPAIPTQQGKNEVESELSEQQLRELYDSEEIDRFLDLFSAVSSCGSLSSVSCQLTPLGLFSMSLKSACRAVQTLQGAKPMNHG
jgi:hypothetical protein